MEETFVQEHASLSTLSKLWGADIIAAGVASFGVSPFITVVDRAVAENASGKRCLMEAVKTLSRSFLQNPLQFCRTKEFAWIFGLYAATYVTANGIETYYDWKEEDGNATKIGCTTAVNMTCVIAKDRAFAQMFGVIKPRPFPMVSVGMFALRDSLTVASCFEAPNMIGEYMTKKYGMNESTSKSIAQVVAPVSVQMLSTPLHLLGLDLYNHRVADWKTRVQFISREYWKSSLMRVARIGPAFGIGAIGNTSCRDRLREMIQ